MPAATATLLEDSAVNIDEWLAGEVEQVFAEQEGAAFVNGDGTNKPKGFLQYTTIAEALLGLDQDRLHRDRRRRRVRRPTSPTDALIDLVYALKAGYRQNARLRDEPQDAGAVRKLKDADGKYLWRRRRRQAAAPACSPSRWSRPRTCRTSRRTRYSIAFGDFRRGYLVVDRQGVRVLRDPYHRQALRAVLHHQARRRRRAGLRRDQAAEVRGVVTRRRS